MIAFQNKATLIFTLLTHILTSIVTKIVICAFGLILLRYTVTSIFPSYYNHSQSILFLSVFRAVLTGTETLQLHQSDVVSYFIVSKNVFSETKMPWWWSGAGPGRGGGQMVSALAPIRVRIPLSIQ